MRKRLLLVVALAVLLVGGLMWHASAQSVGKHFACYAAADPTPTKQFRYLPNPADPCPSPSWVKIDWVDD